MSEMKKKSVETGLEIAVIGMSGRFHNTKNLDEFWNKLKNGVEAISFFLDEELKEAGISTELLSNPNYIKANGILEDKEYFDSSFFGYSPREAEVMDPQVRLFHECSWQALEDAGYEPSSYKGAIGVYAGAASSFSWQALSVLSGAGNALGTFAKGLLHNSDLMSERISHKLNLRGPSFTLFTACSTSLVAIHLACRALLTGECSMALAGGVSVFPKQKGGYMYEEGIIQSPDGHCRAFDAKSKGTVFGEGIGVVVLKRAKEAIADRDNIYALIKGSAVNNDGMTKVDFTAPSVKGQVSVIRTALRLAKVSSESISYIEAHGTGTPLGDPIEISAMTRAFDTDKRKFCAIGSVKTNFGHLDIAAGVTGFIKTVLALKHRLIPPSLHFETPNPDIDFENSPFYVNTQLSRWKIDKYPLRAGVSGFGIGGTNAHVILEEAPGTCSDDNHTAAQKQKLILLSAKTGDALDRATENLAEYLRKNPDINLADAAYTLQVGRKSFQYRRMLVSSDVEEAIGILSSPDSGKLQTAFVKDEDIKTVFMFPGQGAQYVNMGLQLYRTEPVFRKEVDHCIDILNTLMGGNFKDIVYPKDRNKEVIENVDEESEQPVKKINQTEVAQPVIFVFEYALAKLLEKWGIQPDSMIGHSIGEYVAAHLSGVFSLEEALKLVVLRGHLMQGMPTGSMVSTTLSEEELIPILNEEISLAAVNSSSFCVVSGPHDPMKVFREQLQERGYESKPLHTSHAFHSKMMDPVLKKFEEKVREIKINKPQIPFISNVTGKQITFEELVEPVYWSNHLRKTVRFSDGITELLKEENSVFIEVGPGKILSSFVRQHKNKKPSHMIVNLVRHPKENISDDFYLLDKIGKLWLYGKKIDWAGFYSREKRYRISLPSYPFKGQKYWIDEESAKTGTEKLLGNTIYRKPDIAEWFYIPLWEQSYFPEHKPGETGEQLNWLIFGDEIGIVTQLSKRFDQKGHNISFVRSGEKFRKKSDNEYIINPLQEDDYNSLFKEIRIQDKIPHKILHAWNVTGNNKRGTGIDRVDRMLDMGFYSLLNIGQAIGREGITDEIQIAVVTDSMQEVIGDEVICPEKAAVLGAVKVIPLEYSNISCRSIDILIPARGNSQEGKLSHLLSEELISESLDVVVALRGSHRWVQRLKPIRMDMPGKTSKYLREEGVYLITGGLGGIGFTLAEYLAKSVKARLILSSRSIFPKREEWDEWLTAHDETDDISLKIRKVRELENLGARIMIVSADVASREQMNTVINRAKEQFGQLNGILHAAGVIDYGGVIQRRTRKMTENCMESKVKGALVLDDILKDETMDCFVLFSSIANVVYKDKFGQVGFAASNEFLEAFASYKSHRSSTFTVTINWPDWLEKGMVVKAITKRHNGNREKVDADIQSFSDFAISPAEGVEIFNRIMDHSHHRVSVSPQDLGIMVDSMNKQLNSRKEKEMNSAEILKVTEPSESLYQRPELTTKYVAPRNEVEKKLARLFQRFVGIEQVGIHDDFFELGGNSLVAMSVIALIHKELNVKIPLIELFNRPVISSLADYIMNSEESRYLSIQPAKEKEFYPLSSAQNRLYIVQQLNLENTGYNIMKILRLLGEVNKDKLEEIFKKLIRRHESLRTSFVVVDGKPMQKINHKPVFKLEYFDSESYKNGLETAFIEREIIRNFVRAFDLSQAPILRVGLIKLEENEHILIVDMHHIISDGISDDILTKEFIALYRGKELPPLKLQYKDFSEWQNSIEEKEAIKRQEAYWLKELEGELPLLNLPTDYKRPALQNFEGYYIDFPLGKKLSEALYRLAKEKESTLFMVLLAVYNILLFKYSRQEDILVGSTITGRKHAELQKVIGMFVNMLVIRNKPGGEKSFEEFLMEVKEKVLKALENQDYQFEELTKRLGKQGDLERNPLFSTVFQMQSYLDILEEENNNFLENESPNSNSELKFLPYKYDELIKSPFDLILATFEYNGLISMKLTYATKLFKKTTAEKMTEHYIEILNQIVKNSEIKLKDIKISHELIKIESKIHLEDQGDFVF